MFEKLIGKLEEVMQAVRDADRDLRLPRQELGIAMAIKQLRGIVGEDEYINIEPPGFHWHSVDGEITCGEWSVYDGNAHYKGKTLATAMAKIIAAHSTAPSDAPAYVEQRLVEVLDPLPL